GRPRPDDRPGRHQLQRRPRPGAAAGVRKTRCGRHSARCRLRIIMTTEIITFGCRLNAYESEVMAGLAAKAGLEDAVIGNTCAVTAEAERQARQAIRRARRSKPAARIIVTGCAAQIDPARYAAMPEVDRVIGNHEKLDAASFGVGETARV